MKRRGKLTLIILLIVLATISTLSVMAAGGHNTASESIHISTLFSAHLSNTGENRVEEVLVANTENLPAYLSGSEHKGVLLNMSKSQGKTVRMISNPFAVSDNTKDDLLIRVRPAPPTNTFDTHIKGTSYDTPTGAPSAIAANIQPQIRNIKITVSDALYPEIFFEVNVQFQDAGNAIYSGSRIYVKANNQTKSGAVRDGAGTLNTTGAFVFASYWGNTEDFIPLYYDAAANRLYSITHGNSTTPRLIRDFNDDYNGTDSVWGGFPSGFATVDVRYEGGNAEGKLLVTDIDGLRLATDNSGNLLPANVEAYNAKGDALVVRMADTVDGQLGPNSLPRINILGFLSGTMAQGFNEQFTVSIRDAEGVDITDSSVTGLSSGKYTSSSIFTPPAAGTYTVDYTFGEQAYSTIMRISETIDTELLFTYDNTKLNFSYDKQLPSFMEGNTGLGLELTADTTLALKNPVKLSLLNSSTPIVTYLVTPKTQIGMAEVEFTELIITLTDANDATKFVNISNTASTYLDTHSFVSAAATGQEYGAIKVNRANAFLSRKAENGASVLHTFTGKKGSRASETSSLFYYGNAVYAENNSYSPYSRMQIRDFNDPAHMLDGDAIFRGFTSDSVYLTIEFKGVKSQGASVMLYSICGQNLVSREITDSAPPAITIDTEFFEPAQPRGEVGSKYVLPSATAYDFVDGYINDVSVKVFKNYGGSAQQEMTVADGGFVPQTAGDYTIEYNVFDRSFNQSTYTIDIEILQRLQFIELAHESDMPTSAFVGGVLTLPQYQVAGGSGSYTVQETVFAPDGTQVLLGTRTIPINNQGFYCIEYTVTDWHGTVRVFAYYMLARYDAGLTLADPILPIAAVSGRKIVFPAPTAYDAISFLPDVVAADTQIFVTENGTRSLVSADRVYIPQIETGELLVEYVASAVLDKSLTMTKSFKIKVINPQGMGEFFYSPDAEVSVDYRDFEGSPAKEAVFTATKDGAEMFFINKLPASGFQIRLTDAGGSDYQQLRIALWDSTNANRKVEFVISRDSQTQSKLSVNGNAPGILHGSLWSTSGAVFRMSANGVLLNDDGTMIHEITDYLNGSTYNGFSVEGIYMSIAFEGVEESGKAALRINNFYNHPGLYEEINTYIRPLISLEYQLNAYHRLGSEIVLPKMVGHDLFDTNLTLSIKIIAPDGTEVDFGVNSSGNKLLRLTQIGIYQVEYSATSSAGKPSINPFVITAYDDIAPEIEIEGRIKNHYKLNDSLSLPKIRAVDNYTAQEDMRLYKYIIDADGAIAEIGEDGYTFERAGIYTLRLFVRDAAGNHVIKDFRLTVE